MVADTEKIITYSLKNSNDSSDTFYKELSSFTTRFEIYFDEKLGPVLDNYTSFINFNHIELLRDRREYMFDWLAFGVLWRLYISTAVGVSPVSTRLLTELYFLRRNYRKFKPAIDRVRGILSTLLLETNNNRHFSNIPLKIATVTKFLNYLDATGEFREEVKRFKIILQFFKHIGPDKTESIIEKTIEFSGWFKDVAKQEFKDYTPFVESFIANQAKSHRWKEDYLFCNRGETEYYLNMVGSELMNRAFVSNFHQTQRKAVLLPACMRKHANDGQCKAKRISLDFVCTGCDKSCKINQYTQLGKEHDFDVHIIPHSSDFTAWLENFAKDRQVGVVGVACLLNLITGGLELKSLNIPAQCVFLDNCGCTNHWHETGVATDINPLQLLKVLDAPSSIRKHAAVA